MPFYELECCHLAGLDMIKWSRDEYTTKEKIKIIAWAELHWLVDAHNKDAQVSNKK